MCTTRFTSMDLTLQAINAASTLRSLPHSRRVDHLMKIAATASSSTTSSTSSHRCMSTSAVVLAKPRRQRQANDPLALKNMGKFEFDDIPTLAHRSLDRHRKLLKYARIVEHEMPKLAGESMLSLQNNRVFADFSIVLRSL